MPDFAANLKGSLTGTIPKAILCIRKLTKIDSGFSATSRFKLTSNMQKTAGNMEKIESAHFALASAIDDASQNGISTFKDIKGMNPNDFHIMQVQYNPTSLNFHSQAGSFQMGQGAGEAGIHQITQMELPPQTSLACDLIFDAENNYDAFMEEKLVNSIGGIASAVKAAHTLSKGEYSVQVPVDGLLSLITQEATRQVVFHWSKMTFFGELESVNAKYTMFSPRGYPIRAVVSLSIRQNLIDIHNQQNSPDIAYWTNAFDKLFGAAGENTFVDAKASTEKLSNLLNLNF
ncbi:MAG: hypothetical protein PHE02_12075 [Lachnospiraceae bacterium]|nr:hypothetical protein [Lachnospiraceae bacterium]